ncbi:MAG: hypothetical protein M3N93_03155 [Acidobacteriota bacterium]|nr:hypothetical protein [Acidobacteriota bacterium]
MKKTIDARSSADMARARVELFRILIERGWAALRLGKTRPSVTEYLAILTPYLQQEWRRRELAPCVWVD